MKKLIAVLIGSTLPFQIFAETPNPGALSALFENAPRHGTVMAPAVKAQGSTLERLTNPPSGRPSPKYVVRHNRNTHYGFGIGWTAAFTPARYIYGQLSNASLNLTGTDIFAAIFLAPFYLALAPLALLAGIATSCVEYQQLDSWEAVVYQ